MRHKEWRRIAKKERRRRLRCKAAQERNTEEDRLRAALESSADYINWRKEQEELERKKEIQKQEEHAERERLWLEEEERAQKEWQVLQELKAKAKQQELELQMKICKELEAKQEEIRKKKEDKKRQQEEQLRMQEQLRKEIDDYIDNGVKTPEPLRQIADSQPTKDPCPFFSKTGTCRYGDACSKNHRRVFLSKVILVPGFYSHFSLEKTSVEYDTDIALEFESSEMRQHFREFYKDVISELKSFGKIKVFRCCRNTEAHLRGNIYVEYYTERDAARAWRKLKGRWYAGKQLNCEFVNLISWRNAICGMPKCPKGRGACNFIHAFRNPHDEYGVRRRQKMQTLQDLNNSKRSEHTPKWEESVRDNGENRNWRWSESPEVEVNRLKNLEKRLSHRTEREQKSLKEKDECQRSESCSRNSKSFKSVKSPGKAQSSHKRKNGHKVHNEEAISDDRPSRKHKKVSKKRIDSENSHKISKRKHKFYET